MAFKKSFGRSSANPRYKRDSDDRFDKRGGSDRRSGRDFDRRGGSDSRSSGRDSRYKPRLELFNTTCAKCGKTCQVPFKPTGEKPVYCRDCFTKSDSAPRERVSRNDRVTHPSDLDRINEKLDKIMQALKIK
jgi:CxxC-x17-CxxC domain-containing protein